MDSPANAAVIVSHIPGGWRVGQLALHPCFDLQLNIKICKQNTFPSGQEGELSRGRRQTAADDSIIHTGLCIFDQSQATFLFLGASLRRKEDTIKVAERKSHYKEPSRRMACKHCWSLSSCLFDSTKRRGRSGTGIATDVCGIKVCSSVATGSGSRRHEQLRSECTVTITPAGDSLHLFN